MKVAKYITLFLFFLIALLLQTTLVKLLSIKGIKPDLLLIYLVFLTLREGQLKGTIVGFLIGFVQDIYATSLVGLSSLSKSIAGFIAGYFSRKNEPMSPPLVTGVFFLTAFIHEIVYNLIFSLGSQSGFFKILFRYVILKTAYTLTVGLVLGAILPERISGLKLKKKPSHE